MTEYISRKKMYEANKNVWEGVGGLHGCTIFGVNLDMIDSVPAADVRPVVRGEWRESDFIPGMLTCNKCGAQRNPKFKIGGGAWNYCPNCGADMRPEKQKEGGGEDGN